MTIENHRVRLNECANYIHYAKHHRVSADSTKRDALDCARIAAHAVTEHALTCKFEGGGDLGFVLALVLADCVGWAVDCSNVPKGDAFKIRHCAEKALEYAGKVLDTLDTKPGGK